MDGTFEGKKSADKWFPIRLVDATDLYTPETSIVFGSVTVVYGYESATSETSYTVTTNEWKEQGSGNYWLSIGASEFTSEGKYVVNLEATGCHPSNFVVEVRDKTVAEFMDDVGTAGVGLTNLGGMSTGMKAEVQAEAEDAIVAKNLDHLIGTTGTVSDASPYAIYFETDLTEADYIWGGATLLFVSGNLAGEARSIFIYDNTNGAITLASPFSAAPANGDSFVILTEADSRFLMARAIPLIPTVITLSDAVPVRIGIRVQGPLDLTTVSKGTISIWRKAKEATTYSLIVDQGALSSYAGLIYYDEVFDSGSGYALGDTIRYRFSGINVYYGGVASTIWGTVQTYQYSYIAEEILAETVDGAIDMEGCLKILLAVLAGDITRTDNTYVFKEQDGSTKVTEVVSANTVERTIS